MRKIGIVVVAVLALAACSKSTSTTPAPAPVTPADNNQPAPGGTEPAKTYKTKVTADAITNSVYCDVKAEPGATVQVTMTGKSMPKHLPPIPAHHSVTVEGGKVGTPDELAEVDAPDKIVVSVLDITVKGNYTCDAVGV